MRSPSEKQFPIIKGLHKLRLEYVQMRDAYGLEVQWQGPGISKQPIAASYLRVPPVTQKK